MRRTPQTLGGSGIESGLQPSGGRLVEKGRWYGASDGSGRLAATLGRAGSAPRRAGRVACGAGRRRGDRAGHRVLHKGTGVEATTDSLFQIGSISKVYTATVLLRLVDGTVPGATTLDGGRSLAQLLRPSGLQQLDSAGLGAVAPAPARAATHAGGPAGPVGLLVCLVCLMLLCAWRAWRSRASARSACCLVTLHASSACSYCSRCLVVWATNRDCSGGAPSIKCGDLVALGAKTVARVTSPWPPYAVAGGESLAGQDADRGPYRRQGDRVSCLHDARSVGQQPRGGPSRAARCPLGTSPGGRRAGPPYRWRAAERERDTLIAVAWLHDIGYAPELATTGFTRWTAPATWC